MSEVILFSDVRVPVVAYLKPLLNVQVGTKVPATRPAKFVKVEAAGGSQGNLVSETNLLIIQCWATTAIEASDLARKAKAFLNALEGQAINGEWIRKVVTSVPQDFPDPDTDNERFQFTANITLKGRAV